MMRDLTEQLVSDIEVLDRSKQERTPFSQRLESACLKDRTLDMLIYGNEPSTPSSRSRLLYACARWSFAIEEIAVLLRTLDARKG